MKKYLVAFVLSLLGFTAFANADTQASTGASSAAKAGTAETAPLVLFSRPVFTFRAANQGISPHDRAKRARTRIHEQLTATGSHVVSLKADTVHCVGFEANHMGTGCCQLLMDAGARSLGAVVRRDTLIRRTESKHRAAEQDQWRGLGSAGLGRTACARARLRVSVRKGGESQKAEDKSDEVLLHACIVTQANSARSTLFFDQGSSVLRDACNARLRIMTLSSRSGSQWLALHL